MRWITCFILAYLALGIQMGLGEFVRVRGATPNLVLLAVIFITVNAPREPALLAAFMIGLLQDMTTLSPLGLYALSYSAVGMFIVSTQEFVHREHPVTYISLAFVGGSIVSAILLIHGWIRGPRPLVASLFSGVIYTSVLAPFLLVALAQAKRLFAFQKRRRPGMI